MTRSEVLGHATTLPAQRLGSGVLWAGVAALVLVAALRGPLAALVVMAALLVPVVTVKAPEYVLAAGIAGTLTGDTFGTASSVASTLLVVGAVTSAFWLALSPLQVRWQRLVLPLVILAWLALRVFLEEDFETVSDVVKCLAVLVLVLHSLQRRRDVVAGLALGGVVFVLASALLGVDNASGTRFEGISGNPNRMVFGLLLFLPFLLSLLGRGRRTGVRVVALATSATAVVLVVLSGSAQGVAGLATILAVLLACLAVGLPRGLREASVLLALASLVLALGSVARAVRSSQDLQTLSGRTSIYAAAYHDILRNPFAGSGQQRFSEGAVVDRSAHSVVLALAAEAGIPLAVTWVVVLVLLLVSTAALIRARNPLAAAPAVLVTEQFVQTVELIPFTWVVVALFLATSLGSEMVGRGPRARPPEPVLQTDAELPPPSTSPPTTTRRLM